MIMMRKRILAVVSSLTLMFMLTLAPIVATAQEFQPTVGQAGKDVIWVPTPPELVQAMLDMAKVTPDDYLVDLGSGDGRIVIAAAKRGVRALEYNPDMVALSNRNAKAEGVAGKATFQQADIFAADFSKATVLTMYLLPYLNMKLRPIILEMKPGTRVVTHAFNMEDWEPDQEIEVQDRMAYFWIVPAKVAGVWNWRVDTGSAALDLQQTFQKISGSLKIQGKEMPFQNAALKGDLISFSVGDDAAKMQEYKGRINGNTIVGTTKTGNGPESKWTATRTVTK
jgi:hypothetical protein